VTIKRVTLAQPGIPGFFVTGLFCLVLPIVYANGGFYIAGHGA